MRIKVILGTVTSSVFLVVRKMRSYIILVNLLIFGATCNAEENFSMLDKLKSGLQMAGKFLTSDHAKGVANLVSDAFEKSRPHRDNDSNKQNNIFSGFLRILGFDTKKIGAITVNAIIFVAQLISSTIQLKRPSQVVRERRSSDSLYDWVISNTAVTDLLIDAKDEKLSEQVIDYIKERSLDEDTGCIQLLICKSTPFIFQMQKSIKERNNNSTLGYKALYEYLPTVEDVADNGDACERTYHYCTIPL